MFVHIITFDTKLFSLYFDIITLIHRQRTRMCTIYIKGLNYIKIRIFMSYKIIHVFQVIIFNMYLFKLEVVFKF